jgi:hypothetical protein
VVAVPSGPPVRARHAQPPLRGGDLSLGEQQEARVTGRAARPCSGARAFPGCPTASGLDTQFSRWRVMGQGANSTGGVTTVDSPRPLSGRGGQAGPPRWRWVRLLCLSRLDPSGYRVIPPTDEVLVDPFCS